MADPLKRLNYFTGQFLEEPDFKAEQDYHRRVRQMLTYATFTPGVLNGLSVNRIDDSRVLVQRGVAIDALENQPEGDQESRAIVLTDDITTLNLRGGPGGLGFGDGQDVFLYVRHKEDASDGAVPKNTRFQFREEVLALLDSGPGFTLDTNLNIRLAKVQLAAGDLAVVTDAASRQRATLRLGGPGPGPEATLVSISVTPPNATLMVGSSQTYQATGTFDDGSSELLTSADGLTWSSSNAAVVSIDPATGQAQALNATGGTLEIITATVGAVTGTATVQVQLPLPPTISNWPTAADGRRRGTEMLTVFGANFAAPMTVAFPAANSVDPDFEVTATVTGPTQADVVVPGPFSPSSAEPAVVRSGFFTVTTPVGTSAPSPQPFFLLVI